MRRLAVVLAFAGACSGPQNPNAGFDVTVKLTARSKAKCVVVTAGNKVSGNVVVGTNTTIEVGVAQDDPKGGAPLPDTVSIAARGFLSADCDGGTFNEDSTPESDTFVTGKVISKTLTLDGPRDSDADHDGFRSNNDCDDTNAAVFPGASEVCNNRIDDNCDTLIDCADPHCSAMPCNDGDLCSATAVCSGTTCIRTSAVTCSSPSECETAPGMCDAGQCTYAIARGQSCLFDGDAGFCSGTGTCINGEVLCDNGIDDDHDGLIDCADPDCDTQPCDAGLCSQNSRCGGGACAGTPLSCPALGAGCLPAVGCSADAGGCFYGAPLDAGSTCSGGSCRRDGGCGPAETNCSDGVDNDDDGLTDCADSSCDTLMCTDGNACTMNDTCASGMCKGGAMDPCSSPPDACHTATGAMCTPATACLYPVTFDAPCDGGVCRANGACAPSLFPYVPSNFNPDTITPPTHNVFVVCPIFFDTDAVRASLDPDGGQLPDGGALCFPPRFTPTVVHQDGGDDLLVLAVKDLVVADGGSLNFIGSRPVAVAVYGDAIIDHAYVFAGSLYPLADVVGAGGSAPAGRFWGEKSFCAAGTGGNGLFANVAASGGGGGAFSTAGGVGGQGDGQGGGNFVNGGDAGAANGTSSLVPLRGGCAGGAGGPQGDPGGGGGGALQISVAGRLVINAGLVGAPGGGGFGGDSHDTTTPKGGGGGGGSGGAVLLEALHLRVAASGLTANGGSGGGGDGDHAGGQIGGPGNFGIVVAGFSLGGAAGSGSAGSGGIGSAYLVTPGGGGNATVDNAAGGGGGGGLGRIRIYVPDGGTCDLPYDGSVVLSPQPVQIGCP